MFIFTSSNRQEEIRGILKKYHQGIIIMLIQVHTTSFTSQNRFVWNEILRFVLAGFSN